MGGGGGPRPPNMMGGVSPLSGGQMGGNAMNPMVGSPMGVGGGGPIPMNGASPGPGGLGLGQQQMGRGGMPLNQMNMSVMGGGGGFQASCPI
jgi:hypothetical protein